MIASQHSVYRAKIPGTNKALLTSTTKTKCAGWMVDNGSCVGSMGCEVCRSCYCKKGPSAYAHVQKTRRQRRIWFENAPISEVIGTLTSAIGDLKEKYFRGYVGGDFNTITAIQIWEQVAKNLPKVKFWFPTKAYRVPKLLPYLVGLNKLPNVVVRPSGTDFNQDAPVIKGLSAGTTVYTKEHGKPEGHTDCPMSCAGCRRCWNRITKVAYHKH